MSAVPVLSQGAAALQSQMRWIHPVASVDTTLITTNQSQDFALRVLEPRASSGTVSGPRGLLGRNEGGYFWVVLEQGEPIRTNRLNFMDLRNAELGDDGTLTVLVFDQIQNSGVSGGADGIQAQRLAPTGERLWVSERLRMDETKPMLLRLRGTQGIWVAGTRKNSGGSATLLEVAKLDEQGRVVWSQSPSLTPGTLNALNDLEVDAHDEAVLLGSALRADSPDWFVLRLSNSGKLRWLRFMDGIEAGLNTGARSLDLASQLALTSDGEIVVLGFSTTTTLIPTGPRLSQFAAPAVLGRWSPEGTPRGLTPIPLPVQSLDGVVLDVGGNGAAWVGTVAFSNTNVITSLTRVDSSGAVLGSHSVVWPHRVGWEASTLRITSDGEWNWGGTLLASIDQSPIPNDFAANTGLMRFRNDGSLAWRVEWTNWPDLRDARRESTVQQTVLGGFDSDSVLVLRQSRPEIGHGWDLEWHVVDASGKVTRSHQADIGAPWSRFSNPIALLPLQSNDVAYLEVEILSSLKPEPPNEVSWRITRFGEKGETIWSYRHPISSMAISDFDFAPPLVTADGEIVVSRVIGFGEDALLEVTQLDSVKGEVQWSRSLAWPNPTWVPSMAVDDSRRIAVATGIQDPSTTNAVRMTLLQSNGDVTWTRTWLAGQSERHDVWIGASGSEGFYVATANPSSSTRTRAAFVSVAGVEQWNQEVAGTGAYDPRVTDLAGHLYITSGLQAEVGQSDWVTRKLNSQGSLVGTTRLANPSRESLMDASQTGLILKSDDGWFVVSNATERESLVATGRVRYGDWEMTRELLANQTVLEWFQAEPEDLSDWHWTAASARTGFIAAQWAGLERPYTYLFRLDFSPGIVLEAGLTRVHTLGEPGKLHVCRRATSLLGPWERVAEVRASLLGDLRISEPTQSRSRAFYQFEPVP